MFYKDILKIKDRIQIDSLFLQRIWFALPLGDVIKRESRSKRELSPQL
jgi:hypothetical protein